MPRTDEESLEMWRKIKDKVEDDMLAGEDVTSYRIGDREVTRQPVSQQMELAKNMIEYYEKRVNETGGINLADFSG